MQTGFRILHEKHRHLAEEFKSRPIGHHSPELRRILTIFRSEPVKGRYVLLCTEPYKKWVVGQLSGERGKPTEIFHDKVFESLEEANWEVFRLRWNRHTGHSIS
jgi:hypothetical protein